MLSSLLPPFYLYITSFVPSKLKFKPGSWQKSARSPSRFLVRLMKLSDQLQDRAVSVHNAPNFYVVNNYFFHPFYYTISYIGSWQNYIFNFDFSLTELLQFYVSKKLHTLMQNVDHHLSHLWCIPRRSSEENEIIYKEFKSFLFLIKPALIPISLAQHYSRRERARLLAPYSHFLTLNEKKTVWMLIVSLIYQLKMHGIYSAVQQYSSLQPVPLNTVPKIYVQCWFNSNAMEATHGGSSNLFCFLLMPHSWRLYFIRLSLYVILYTENVVGVMLFLSYMALPYVTVSSSTYFHMPVQSFPSRDV